MKQCCWPCVLDNVVYVFWLLALKQTRLDSCVQKAASGNGQRLRGDTPRQQPLETVTDRDGGRLRACQITCIASFAQASFHPEERVHHPRSSVISSFPNFPGLGTLIGHSAVARSCPGSGIHYKSSLESAPSCRLNTDRWCPQRADKRRSTGRLH